MIKFLTPAQIITVHRRMVEMYGGTGHIRDAHSLASACAQPRATWEGRFLHPDIAHMAAAYAFHLAHSRPFYCHSLKTAFLSALVFAELNGWQARDAQGLAQNLHRRELPAQYFAPRPCG